MILIIRKIALKLLFISDFWLGISNLKKLKALKKQLNEELMLVMLLLCQCGFLEDGGTFGCQRMTERSRTYFLLSNAFNVSVVYNMEHFGTRKIYVKKYFKQFST